MHGHTYEYFANIFAKTKKVAKPFLPVYMGPRWSFFEEKKGPKSRDTVPLRRKFILLNRLLTPGFVSFASVLS